MGRIGDDAVGHPSPLGLINPAERLVESSNSHRAINDGWACIIDNELPALRFATSRR
jgi:hypothetical protein